MLDTAPLMLSLALAAANPTQVRTASGVVQGSTIADGRIRVFKGIPFAAPPTGELRWQAPRPGSGTIAPS